MAVLRIGESFAAVASAARKAAQSGKVKVSSSQSCELEDGTPFKLAMKDMPVELGNPSAYLATFAKQTDGAKASFRDGDGTQSAGISGSGANVIATIKAKESRKAEKEEQA